MKYVVTGGAGAIGSRLVQRLLDGGADRVIVVDDLSSGHEWLLPKDPRLELRRDSVTNIDAYYPESNFAVFHLAALFANQNSIENPEDDLFTNAYGTLKVLRWALKHDARFVVYAGAGCSVGSERTPYQISKAFGESYCRYFREQLGLDVRIRRLRNSYGPGEVPGIYRNAIPNFVWTAMHDAPITITGTGDESRDFVYVDDTVNALCRTDGPEDVGTGVKTCVRWLVDAILSITKSKSEIRFAPARPWEHPHAPCTEPIASPTLLLAGLERTYWWLSTNSDRIERMSR